MVMLFPTFSPASVDGSLVLLLLLLLDLSLHVVASVHCELCHVVLRSHDQAVVTGQVTGQVTGVVTGQVTDIVTSTQGH